MTTCFNALRPLPLAWTVSLGRAATGMLRA